MKNSISVVIPTWNAARYVDRVLDALVHQEGVDYEILVVDNGVVNQETENVVNRYKIQFSSIRYLKYEKQLGYAGAVNEGTRLANFDLIAVLNNDNIPHSTWLRELFVAYDPIKKPIISSLVQRPGMENPMGAVLNLWARVVWPHGFKRQKTLFHPDGSAFLFSRDVFGIPYDEDYFIYQEDVALGWRAWLKGHEVWLAENARADSFDGGSTRRIAYKTAYFTERNRWLNYFCFLSNLSLLRLLPILLFDLMVKMIAGSNRKAKIDAWYWLVTNGKILREKRRIIQEQRMVNDNLILCHLSPIYFNETTIFARMANFFIRLLCFYPQLGASLRQKKNS